MIESIVVRDVATYAHEGVAFDNLQLINFIYGGNGCGKTTLSRLLASTEPEKEYPTCEIKWTTKPKGIRGTGTFIHTFGTIYSLKNRYPSVA